MRHALRETAVSLIRRSASAQRTEDELESTQAVFESCSQEIRKHREHDQHDRQMQDRGINGRNDQSPTAKALPLALSMSPHFLPHGASGRKKS